MPKEIPQPNDDNKNAESAHEGQKARCVPVNIDELIGKSKRRRRAFDHASDVLEAASLIRGLREQAGFSQEELAKTLRTSLDRINVFERGTSPSGPSFTTLKHIARVCGDPVVTADVILTRSPTEI